MALLEDDLHDSLLVSESVTPVTAASSESSSPCTSPPPSWDELSWDELADPPADLVGFTEGGLPAFLGMPTGEEGHQVGTKRKDHDDLSLAEAVELYSLMLQTPLPAQAGDTVQSVSASCMHFLEQKRAKQTNGAARQFRSAGPGIPARVWAHLSALRMMSARIAGDSALPDRFAASGADHFEEDPSQPPLITLAHVALGEANRLSKHYNKAKTMPKALRTVNNVLTLCAVLLKDSDSLHPGRVVSIKRLQLQAQDADGKFRKYCAGIGA